MKDYPVLLLPLTNLTKAELAEFLGSTTDIIRMDENPTDGVELDWGPGWIAIVPGLLGCAIVARTAPEALRLVTIAKDQWLQLSRENGVPDPPLLSKDCLCSMMIQFENDSFGQIIESMT